MRVGVGVCGGGRGVGWLGLVQWELRCKVMCVCRGVGGWGRCRASVCGCVHVCVCVCVCVVKCACVISLTQTQHSMQTSV